MPSRGGFRGAQQAVGGRRAGAPPINNPERVRTFFVRFGNNPSQNGLDEHCRLFRSCKLFPLGLTEMLGGIASGLDKLEQANRTDDLTACKTVLTKENVLGAWGEQANRILDRLHSPSLAHLRYQNPGELFTFPNISDILCAGAKLGEHGLEFRDGVKNKLISTANELVPDDANEALRYHYQSIDLRELDDLLRPYKQLFEIGVATEEMESFADAVEARINRIHEIENIPLPNSSGAVHKIGERLTKKPFG